MAKKRREFRRRTERSTHTHGEISRETAQENPARPSEIGLAKERADGRGPESSKGLDKLNPEASNKVEPDPGAAAAARGSDAQDARGRDRLAGAQRAWIHQRAAGQENGPAVEIVPTGWRARIFGHEAQASIV